MDSSVEMNNVGQYFGESLMDAWYRIKGMSKNGVNKHTPATLIRNFYKGLDGWLKCFLDSLTNGRFASGNPSHANNLMENLFGNSIETKDEIGIKQLKVSMDRSILGLQTYVEEYPTKNEMHSFILHTKSRHGFFPRQILFKTLMGGSRPSAAHSKPKGYAAVGSKMDGQD